MNISFQKKLALLLKKLRNFEQFFIAAFTLKWLIITLVIGILIGSASAIFLILLDWAILKRELNTWIIFFLPLGGLLIGFMYYYLGQDVESGNNILIEEIHNPNKIIPFKMAPLILIGTVATHLFGGSAGREGTAAQMGGSLADQLTKLLRLKSADRIILLIAGISGGFSSVFGTPLAGAIFGLEVFMIGQVRYTAIFPSFICAIIADYVCGKVWGVKHSKYVIDIIPELTVENFLYTIIAGIIFGITSVAFGKLNHSILSFSKSKIKYPPFRPLIGGCLILGLILIFGTTKYVGLGLETISSAFTAPLPYYDFALKILFTAITLGFGFKGGEVTPLFFIGATLGNALSFMIPLPISLLAGMGFVAVFAGAANTPIATTLMAAELFGIESGIYVGLASVVAYIFSGHTGIYSSQIIGSSKNHFYNKEQGQKLSNVWDKKRKR